MGWLPAVGPGVAGSRPGWSTRSCAPRASPRLGKRLAGHRRTADAPLFAGESFVQWWRARGIAEPDPGDPRAVVLWPDTFTTYFHPASARAAVRVLEDAGFRVAVPAQAVCCGLTWISTGQLAIAKQVLRRTAGRPAALDRGAAPRWSASNRRAPPSSAPTRPS